MAPNLMLVPELGLEVRLNEMHAFCKGVDYKTTGGSRPGELDATRWCFRSSEDAAAFRRNFAAGNRTDLSDGATTDTLNQNSTINKAD